MGCEIEYYIQSEIKKAWNVSLKYSTILMNSIHTETINELFTNIHKQFSSEIKQFPYKNKIYQQIWNTSLRTLIKNTDLSKIRSSIRILHQTNVQRLSRF